MVKLLAGILQDNKTYVSFNYLLESSTVYNSYLSAFQSKINTSATAKGNGEIEEVIITALLPLSGNTYYGFVSGGSSYSEPTIGGGCTDFRLSCIQQDTGGGGGESESTLNQNIIDNLEGYPCAQDLLKQLPNLNNDLAKQISKLFGKNEDFNIIFKPKSGLGEIDGESYSHSVKEFGTFKATIYLNEDILNNATKEYILVTMYHEALHAYLDYELSNLGQVTFNNLYPELYVSYQQTSYGTVRNVYSFLDNHGTFGLFLTDLKNALYSFNPNLPSDVMSALVKSGITTLTLEEVQKNLNERDVRTNKFAGTKCP